MESSTHKHNYNHQNGQPGSGLPRFRSAPISLLADANQHDAVLGFQEFEDKSAVARLKESTAVNYGSLGLPPHYPRQNNSGASCSAMDSSSYADLFGSAANSSLSRQSSSPAGLFGSHHLGVQNGYVIMKGGGNYAGVNGTNGEVSLRLKSQLSFSSRVPSSFGKLSQISEVGTESTEAAGANDDDRFFSTSGVPYSSWNGTNFSENFNSMKRDQQNNGKLFSCSQNGEIGDRMHLLSHHLSLPKTSAEMVAMEKFLHFQDSVPCKIRAKRGCATHPRSIAERVRRTRISERMRKLQELVPNMDKQTNTADMLDLAVDYIKNLQRQYKTLSENRANCKCLSKPVQNQLV